MSNSNYTNGKWIKKCRISQSQSQSNNKCKAGSLVIQNCFCYLNTQPIGLFNPQWEKNVMEMKLETKCLHSFCDCCVS